MLKATGTKVLTGSTPKTLLEQASKEFEARYNELRESGSCIPGEDHTYVGGPYLISRPYSLDRATVASLLRFVEENGLEFNIEDASSWHPSTMTVRLWKQEWVQEFLDAADSCGGEFRSEVSALLERQMNPRVT